MRTCALDRFFCHFQHWRMRFSLSLIFLGVLHLCVTCGSVWLFSQYMTSMTGPTNGAETLNSCSKVAKCINCFECELSKDQIRCCDGPCNESSICPTSVMSKAAYRGYKSARRNDWPFAVLSLIAAIVFASFVAMDIVHAIEIYITDVSAPLLPRISRKSTGV